MVLNSVLQNVRLLRLRCIQVVLASVVAIDRKSGGYVEDADISIDQQNDDL